MNSGLVQGKYIVVAGMTVLLAACGGGGSSSTSSTGGGSSPTTYSAASGVAQKGPLLKGSTVTAQELNASLSPTGKQYTYLVNSDLGTFTPTSTFGSQYIGLNATGYYFDEVQGAVSSGTITLNGVSDLSSDKVLNVNILTTLAYQRIINLVTRSGMTVAAATTQAENEVLAALNIRNGSSYGNFSALDLSQNSQGDQILAAISSLFVFGNNAGQASSLIASFQSDIADNGVIDSQATKTALATASQNLNPATVAANLTNEYSSLNVAYTASDISNWIDQTGNGIVGEFKNNVTNAALSATDTSTPYVVQSGDNGSTFSVTSGTLLVNGVAAPPAGAVVKTGDTLTISLAAAASAGTSVSSYLMDGTQRVYELTVATSGILDTSFNAAGATPGIATYNGSGITQAFGITQDASNNIITVGQSGGSMALWRTDSSGNVSLLATEPNGYGSSVAVDSNGKIVVGGSSLWRFNTNGSLDTSFNPNGTTPGVLPLAANTSVSALKLDASGNIVIAGITGGTETIVERFLPSGALDTSFDAGSSNPGEIFFHNTVGGALAIDANGKIDVASVPSGGTGVEVWRINSKGLPDTTFSSTGTTPNASGMASNAFPANLVSGMTLDAQGNILVTANQFLQPGNNAALIRFTPSGAADTTFNANGATPGSVLLDNAVISGIALDIAGRIVVTGNSANPVASNNPPNQLTALFKVVVA